MKRGGFSIVTVTIFVAQTTREEKHKNKKPNMCQNNCVLRCKRNKRHCMHFHSSKMDLHNATMRCQEAEKGAIFQFKNMFSRRVVFVLFEQISSKRKPVRLVENSSVQQSLNQQHPNASNYSGSFEKLSQTLLSPRSMCHL